MPMSAPEALPISAQYGEYSTLYGTNGQPSVLGVGGFGTTVRAFRSRKVGSTEIRDDFALKILRFDADEDSKQRGRVLKEILALRDLQHPNLARYIDCGEKDGCVFLVMELCQGGDLSALVKRVGVLRERFALQLIVQVCAGLEEAHRKGYLHRDLKPTNILLNEEVPAGAGAAWLDEQLGSGHLRFKVVDFGLANRVESEVRGGGFAGSPMFASPEQVREHKLSEKSDIYSLGMTLWYLVAGKGPLLNADGATITDPRAAMRGHTSPMPHDAAFSEHWSAEFKLILSRMVRKAPEERFASVHELAVAIQRQLELMPQTGDSPESSEPESQEEKVAPSFDDWGSGDFADHYDISMQVGRRAMGKFYQARQKLSGDTVGFTAWIATNSPTAESEKKIGAHLSRLWEVTNSRRAPAVLTRITDVRRTANEWCVAEEWSEGERLERYVALHGRSLPLKEATQLLFPIAEACDYLQETGIESALLTIEEVRIVSPKAKIGDASWLEKPMDEWGKWSVRLSALSIPAEIAGEGSSSDSMADSSVSSFAGFDAGRLKLNKGFCRLLYRMIEGADVAIAADWDAESYSDAVKLNRESNVLLRDYICGAVEDGSVVEILRRICANEGISNLPQRAECTPVARQKPEAPKTAPVKTEPPEAAYPTIAPTVTFPSSKSTAFPKPPSVAPSTRMVPPPSSAPPAPASSSTAFASRTPIPNPSVTMRGRNPPVAPTARSSTAPRLPRMGSLVSVDAAPAPAIEVAQLVPGRPGWVKSPYGRRKEQQVPGTEWHEEGQVRCEETGQPFQLPVQLPPLEATLIDRRFDAVLSPYVSPAPEIPVPLGKWMPDAELTCRITGRPLRMPHRVPPAEAILVEPGVVQSPYGNRPECPIEPTAWKPGELLLCPESEQIFVLPEHLPPLVAEALEVPGTFVSPYAPEQPFALDASQCLPLRELACPVTGSLIALPAVLPTLWIFAGEVRQAEIPEARSPYVEDEGECWQSIPATDWASGATVKCARTGKAFSLPESLPVLRVAPGPKIPSVLSPFRPHPAIAVAPEQWIAGAEITLSLGFGTECRVILPEDLLPIGRVDAGLLASLPQGQNPEARGSLGVIQSPFDEGCRLEIPGAEWLMGNRFLCPTTERPFWLPEGLPSLEARLGSDLGTVISPYSNQPVEIAAQQWVEGQQVTCPESGSIFVLPAGLPMLEGKIDERTPGRVASPFDSSAVQSVEYFQWKPSLVLDCPRTGREFSLPKSLPEWVLEAAVVEESPGTVRSPHAAKPEFEVAGPDWVAGALVQCPDTQKPLRLPASLPALEATLVEGKPGSVLSPYVADPNPQRVARSGWKSENVIACAVTNRPMVLPAELPALPSLASMARRFRIPAAAIVAFTILGLIVFVVRRTHDQAVDASLSGKFDAGLYLKTQNEPDEIPSIAPVITKVVPAATPAPEIARPPMRETPAPPPPPVATWPTKVVLAEGIKPKAAFVTWRSSSGEQTPSQPIALNGAESVSVPVPESFRAALNDPAADLTLIVSAKGFEDQPLKITRSTALTFVIRDRVRLTRAQGTATWAADDPFLNAAYRGLRFKLIDPIEGEDDPETQVLSTGRAQVPTGQYNVTILGKPGYSDDRLIGALEVLKNAPSQLHALPSLPRNLAGLASYTDRFFVKAYGDRTVTDLSVGMPVYLNYWKASLVVFSADFKSGRLIEENSLIGSNGFNALDTMVVAITLADQRKAPGRALNSYLGYTQNAKSLDAAFDALKTPDKLLSSSPKALLARRLKFFDATEDIWASAQKRKLGEELVEIGAEGNRNDLRVFREALVKYKPAFQNGQWERLVSAALDPASAPIDWAEVASLLKPVSVNGETLSGLFIEQHFTVDKIDSSGVMKVTIQLKFYNPYNRPVPIVVPIEMRLSRAEGGKFTLSFDSDQPRIVTVAPVTLKNAP